jgi:hypothetical protein
MRRYGYQIREKKQLVMSTSFRGQYWKRCWVAERLPLVASFLIAVTSAQEAEHHYENTIQNKAKMDIGR